jgi:hypothetical protein
MKKFILIAVLLLITKAFATEPNEPNVSNDYNDLNYLHARIKQLEKTIEAKNRLIATMRQELSQCKEQNKTPVKEKSELKKEQQSINCLDLHVGQIGPLTNNIIIKTVQIIDVNNMIAELLCDYISQYTGAEKRAIWRRTTKIVWIKGINTQNMVDDQTVDVGDRVFKITGTKTYNTIDGAMTVFVIEPVEF